jgi:hypothetical protein
MPEHPVSSDESQHVAGVALIPIGREVGQLKHKLVGTTHVVWLCTIFI